MFLKVTENDGNIQIITKMLVKERLVDQHDDKLNRKPELLKPPESFKEVKPTEP